MSVPIFLGTAARRAHGSSAEHAMRDLIASHAPLRDGSHKARQNGPKHYPGDSRGRSPLARLSPLSFVVQRKMGPPEVAGLVERLVKNVQRKIWCREANALGVPPEGLPIRECP